MSSQPNPAASPVENIALPVDAVSNAPDVNTKTEEDDLESQRKTAELLAFQQNITERKKYAERAFWLVVIWLGLIGVILVFQGFKLLHFELSSGVLVALITSTTSGVVGIFLIVTRYLFHHDDEPSESK